MNHLDTTRSLPSSPRDPRCTARVSYCGFMAFFLTFFFLTLTKGLQAQEHDCTPYQPTVAGQVFDDPSINFGTSFEIDRYELTVPADPGGGYVVARAEMPAPFSPHMRIIPPSGLGVVTQNAPNSVGSLSPQVLEVAFEVDADTTFEVEMLGPAQTGVPYEWSWSFVSRVDCYEENDNRPLSWPDPIATSRTVPFDQVLEAFSLAGHQTFSISAVDANNYDWYDFTIDEPTAISIGTLDVPTDQSLRLRLFGDDGLTILDHVPEVGHNALIGPRLLQPGTYYFELHPEVRGDREVTLSEGESIPDHFDRPYLFLVSTQPRCWPGRTRACLQDERFMVEVEWRDFSGASGPGELVDGGTDDSRLFTFFEPDNWEMLVKVLDGCAVNGHFWVFSAATTDVEYTLRVTDTVTGVVREYENPLGQAADATTDTTAFACGEAAASWPGAPVASHSKLSSLRASSAGAVSTAGLVGLPFGGATSCTETNTAHCLNSSRFAVQVEWRDFQGTIGDGRTVELRSDVSGLFWFFEPDNWEMLVKVLDGCAINGHYWVFSAATTNVEFTLHVTDTVSGAAREYGNELGAAAPALTDTEAIPCSQ